MGDISHNNAATPMVKQYLEIKRQYNDAILFFRLGDFYEMFFDDAVVASTILEITLTSRNKKDSNPIPLCGIPYHSVEPYIAKLLEHGKKVAICEQIEDPRLAKGVVRREVTRIYTPGVIPDGASLDAASNNFVAAISWDGSHGGVAYADISTGLFKAMDVASAEEIHEELSRIEPREILLDSADANTVGGLTQYLERSLAGCARTTAQEGWFCGEHIAALEGGQRLMRDAPHAARAAGAIYAYLRYTQRGDPRHITVIEGRLTGDAMVLDDATKRNLEIVRTLYDGSVRGSLLWLMNRTQTAMGGRLLREWLCSPLTAKGPIDARLDAVESLVADASFHGDIRAAMGQIADIERLSTRMVMGTGNARDMRGLARSLRQGAEIKKLLAGRCGLWEEIDRDIGGMDSLAADIMAAIVDDPPHGIREGGMIRDGVNDELDSLRAIRSDARGHLARMEAEEKASTGIGSLKVRFNKVFGYYIEITNTHRHKVPAHYMRKQTLSNAERYVTEELKVFEERVLGAEDNITALEHKIFCGLRERMAAQADAIGRMARGIAQADVFASLAQIAREYRYSRPKIATESVLDIEQGRHPVVERMQCEERFVPNDVVMGTDANRLLMITGPNMAGKSTVMRQTALIVMMAQMGSFVPATRATVGLVDRIFTRIGASDALAKGRSTFMVEMTEVASILAQATCRSLIIVDEVGRGTSTFDGLAIAWAVAEELCDRVRARTMFATHYHELTELAVTRPAICNVQIAVKEWNDQIIFLRRMVPGGTSHSYGIQVARLAGLVPHVVQRAREILANLERGEFDEIGRPRIAYSHDGEVAAKPVGQLALFTAHPVVEQLRTIDPEALTPMEALNLLHRWRQTL